MTPKTPILLLVPGYTKLNFGECPVLWSVRGLEKDARPFQDSLNKYYLCVGGK